MIRAWARFFLLGFGLLLILAGSAFGQEADTSAVLPAPPDTAQAQSADLDTVISYSSKNIEFLVDQKLMLLSGNAKIRYKAMTLSAEKISVDWEQNLVIAEGVVDTIWADSLKTVVDSIFIKGKPVFAEGDQEITGARMTYNLKSRRGRISEGTTQYLDGYYWGEALKKDTSQVLYAGPGHFTTCSNDDPHYSFRSRQMKLIVNDKAVAKPVVLYFKD